MDSLSGFEEIEAVVERVLNRVLNNREGQDVFSTETSVPENVTITDLSDGVSTDRLDWNEEGKKRGDFSSEAVKKATSTGGLESRSEDANRLRPGSVSVQTKLELKLLEQAKVIAQLKTHVGGQRAENQKLSTQNEALEAKIQRQRHELTMLETKIRGTNSKGVEKKTLIAKIDEQNIKIGRQCKELGKLNEKIQCRKVAEKENVLLKAKIEEQSKKIHRQSKELDALNAKVQEQSKTMNTLNLKIHYLGQIEEDNKILRLKAEEHNKKVEQQRDELVRHKKCASSKEKKEYQNPMAKLEQEIESIERQKAIHGDRYSLMRFLGLKDEAQWHEKKMRELSTKHNTIELEIEGLAS
eukprot:CAMPEP_0183722228 /NCGR_PEP_ID=MMETSP0737-20130205/14252_1 /TAXON_ID=385413 /ORGANISM="Thalassiosira miniscula, Strain CCMP1093" /LENGTH=354 /DNA_ID=CAMNT_0025952355 /DNA_START=8 /DNA_END=1072 /DNA_ORIENTATION=+